MESERRDWLEWHRPYDDPASSLSRRLGLVRQEFMAALDVQAGPVRVISMCAGQGRDVLPVLAGHRKRSEISAVLVEIDPRNVAIATAEVKRLGLMHVRVLEADAALTDNYAGSVPADIILACGIFGNISDDDIRRTIGQLPSLCAAGATVIWTRGRNADRDLGQDVRQWFAAAGFRETAFHAPDDMKYRVGVSQLAIPPRPFTLGVRMFQFLR